MTIWIGEIQWMLDHGFHYRHDPILQPLDSIATKDALLDQSDPTNPRDAEWPAAEFIVGNPPFLGNRLLRRSLGHEYTERCGPCSRVGCRPLPTCAATGTRRHEPRSRQAGRGVRGCWRLRQFGTRLIGACSQRINESGADLLRVLD